MSGSRRQKWEREVLEPAKRRNPERRAEFRLTSGTEINPIYTTDDLQGADLE
jgi:hypothetical protein